MRISDWSSDVCSSDLRAIDETRFLRALARARAAHLCARRGEPDRDGSARAQASAAGAADRVAHPRHDEQHRRGRGLDPRSEEHTSELQSLMRISYAVFCLKKKKAINTTTCTHTTTIHSITHSSTAIFTRKYTNT